LKTIGEGLENPSGVAIQPDTGDVFVAERPGIVRFTIGRRGQIDRTVEINDFPTDQYGKGPIYDIGPLGLAFAATEYLVVGDGSQKDTDEVIRIYQLGREAPAQPKSAGDCVLSLGPLPSTEQLLAEGNYYAVVVTDEAIYATANGDDTKGWIVRSLRNAEGIPQELTRFLATKEAVNRDAPVALTTNRAGDLVVGQMGEINIPGDSLLSIYDPKTGDLKANYETGIHDITGLAYDSDGTLYATDFAWLDASQGALYKLTVEGDECTATKVFDLDKPTALAFDEDDNLYITIFGTAEEGSEKKPGRLLRISKADLAKAAKD
jgi:DNA-binding beta-propeller fold protein YncE